MNSYELYCGNVVLLNYLRLGRRAVLGFPATERYKTLTFY
jgi:hypothetical protein